MDKRKIIHKDYFIIKCSFLSLSSYWINPEVSFYNIKVMISITIPFNDASDGKDP
jgi:hypothetical protein